MDTDVRTKGPEPKLQPLCGHWLPGEHFQTGWGWIPSLHSRSLPAEPKAWGLAFGKVGLDLLVHLDHSPQAPDAESFKHKGGRGQLLPALQSKLTQSSRSRTAVGMEAGVSENRGLKTGRDTRMTGSTGDRTGKEGGQGSEDRAAKTGQQAEARGLEASPKRKKEPYVAAATIPKPPGGSGGQPGSAVECLYPLVHWT